MKARKKKKITVEEATSRKDNEAKKFPVVIPCIKSLGAVEAYT